MSSKIIFTGGSGLLGSDFKKIRPDIDYPTSKEFDVTKLQQMKDYIGNRGCDLIIHAAAFTSPPMIDKDPSKAIEVNIIGTSNIVKLCSEFDARLIYICTDYVFKGDKGNYTEDDPVYPVNKYAWSKLGGECAVRMYDKSLIIRTTFGPNVFPYEKAFIDQWTSRESVSVIAEMISQLIDKDIIGIIHVGGKRKTVFEYAKSLDETKDIGQLSINDVSFKVPVDTSLNCDKYNESIHGLSFKSGLSSFIPESQIAIITSSLPFSIFHALTILMSAPTFGERPFVGLIKPSFLRYHCMLNISSFGMTNFRSGCSLPVPFLPAALPIKFGSQYSILSSEL